MNKLLLLCVLVTTSSYAATINFSEEIIPLEVNNKKIEKSFFSRTSKIEIQPGSHKLKIQYQDLYEIDYDDHETIESETFWIVVDIENNEDEYLLSIPRPDDLESAKLFIKKPYVELSRLGSQNKLRLEPVATALMVMETPKISEKPIKQPITKNTTDVSNSTDSVKTKTNSASSDLTNPEALSMLEFWWSQASAKERKAFLKDKKSN